MKIKNDTFEFSASDLSNHLGCKHLTQLNSDVAKGYRDNPKWYDPTLEVLIQRGREFEAQYLQFLIIKGLSISKPGTVKETDESAFERTINEMKKGTDVIYQASLHNLNWGGRADFLIKVPLESALGSWSYEVQDTKLAIETKAGTILQLCLYSQLLELIQNKLPEWIHVIVPSDNFEPISYKVNDFIAFTRLIQNKLITAIKNNDTTYPDPVSQCETCRWWKECNDVRRADDHLCFVAGMSNLHMNELKSKNVNTMELLANEKLPLDTKPTRGSRETFIKIQEQAKIQYKSKKENQVHYELLPPAPNLGLAKLPAPSKGDIFLDFEGDPYIENNGLIYLFGWTTIDEGQAKYHHSWSLNHGDENAIFESFIDLATNRLISYPDLHIYHFGHYEQSALKKMMGKYATREEELDNLLRANLFVDLHSIIKQSLRAGVEAYSIKNLEVLYGYQRQVQLKEASLYIYRIERMLELNQVDLITPAIKSVIENYNADDCCSTSFMRDWLEKLREQSIKNGIEIPRPKVEIKETKADDLKSQIQEVYNKLVEDLPLDRNSRTDMQQAKWILANLLGYHQREMKSIYWDYFRLKSLSDEDYLDEKTAISGLNFLETISKTKTGIPIDRYTFPFQEIEIRSGDSIETREGVKLGEVESIDEANGIIDIKKTNTSKDLHPSSGFKNEIVGDKGKRNAILRIAQWVTENDIESKGSYNAIRDLLCKKPPNPVQTKTEYDSLTHAVQWGLSLQKSYLPIQGPPGSGKTFTGARMITALVEKGFKVGVTSLSHKVIRNLLEAVIRAAKKENIHLICAEKVNEVDKSDSTGVIQIKDNAKVVKAIDAKEVNVIGGTAWLWAREDMYEKVDYLVIDEASQLSLADTVAVSQATKNLILLGDPQQLNQPQQGSHPENTDVSALEYILGDDHTITANRGLFLSDTYRLHPHICAFTSELFYDRRLNSLSGLENQVLIGKTKYAGAGLWLDPVNHKGNQSSSWQEVEKIKQIFDELLNNDIQWKNAENKIQKLSLNDILVIAPYNAQVAKLKKMLPPSSRIGTVDKFQGQEAPVVIYSMTTSTEEDAPRGMEFLYSLNRLNVAVSRAKSVCILVASPALLEPDCKSPHQMRLANALCRYVELAKNDII